MQSHVLAAISVRACVCMCACTGDEHQPQQPRAHAYEWGVLNLVLAALPLAPVRVYVPAQVMNINPNDRVLTLTSGGCNALNLLLEGAGEVVSVDCNPAQVGVGVGFTCGCVWVR